MKRTMITIDEKLCNGCGDCIPKCPEGALEIVDGVARLVSEVRCDGLGACLGHCPEGAITVEEREAPPYDERVVLEGIIPKGATVLRAHLDHLREHGQLDDLAVAEEILRARGISLDEVAVEEPKPSLPSLPSLPRGCPGSAARAFGAATPAPPAAAGGVSEARPSKLTHWPVQMHLINPAAPFFAGRDLLLSADCVAFAVGGFHERFLDGRTLAIACPKLDQGQESYLAKLVALVDEARINTLTVATMEVPCCSGLLLLARQAVAQARRKVPVRSVVVGVQGGILSDDWV